MRRIYFRLPNAPVAKAIVDELLLAHVEWRHIHVLARAGTDLQDQLPGRDRRGLHEPRELVLVVQEVLAEAAIGVQAMLRQQGADFSEGLHCRE